MKTTKNYTNFWSSLKAIFCFLPLVFIFNASAQLADQKTKPGEVKDMSSADYDLTDQDRFESKVFVHEGLSQRTMDEKCEELKDSAACQGRGKTEFMGMDSTLVQTVARAYSVIGGMMGMGGDAFDFEVDGEEAIKENDGEKTKKNYCTMIPAVGEMLAMFNQQTSQNQIQSQPMTQETAQKETLYRAARSHEARSKSANIQAKVWMATAGCYAAYMAAGSIVIDWKVILQFGAATFLWRFWENEAKEQQKYADEVKRIAEELPGKGDCNPHTENHCYCSQKETKYDPVHCLPQLHKRAIANDSFRVPCTDKNMKPDASCDCISREACFDTEFFSDMSAPGFVQFAKSSTGKDVGKLLRGELTNGNLAAGSANNNAARLLKDMASKIDQNPSLDKKGSAVAKEFEKANIPRPIARLLASRPITPQARQRVAGLSANINDSKKKYSVAKKSGGTGVLRFNRANGKIGAGKKKSGNNYNNLFNKFKKKNKKGRKRNGVLKFAQKAERAAQISRNKDRPIFEIISRRYQVSGYRRLEIK